MATMIIRFLNIVMAGLLAGTVFGIWIGYNPKNFSTQTYLEQQQGAIKNLNTLLPLIGLVTIILTLISAFQQKQNKQVSVTLLLAAILFIIAGLVTKFGNQPINSIVMSWDKGNMPNNWAEIRDRWWSLHITRTMAIILAFCLVVWSTMQKN